MKKVYIAGKVTGEPRLERAAKFQKAQEHLRSLGFDAVNPLEVVGSWEVSWKEAMRKCIAAMMECEIIYLLPCAHNSKGAKLEIRLALELGITVMLMKNSEQLEKFV